MRARNVITLLLVTITCAVAEASNFVISCFRGLFLPRESGGADRHQRPPSRTGLRCEAGNRGRYYSR